MVASKSVTVYWRGN